MTGAESEVWPHVLQILAVALASWTGSYAGIKARLHAQDKRLDSLEYHVNRAHDRIDHWSKTP